MEYIKSVKLESIKDFKEKVKACQALGFRYKLEGTLKEFTYDIFNEAGMKKPSLVGSFSRKEEIDYLRRYYEFEEKMLKTKRIRANDDPYLPDEEIIECDVLVWNKRFFVFEDTSLEMKYITEG